MSDNRIAVLHYENGLQIELIVTKDEIKEIQSLAAALQRGVVGGHYISTDGLKAVVDKTRVAEHADEIAAEIARSKKTPEETRAAHSKAIIEKITGKQD